MERPRLLLKFAILLKYTGENCPSLLFHRWFPDGEKDSIALETGQPFAKLKVWFNRKECHEAILGDPEIEEADIPTIGVIGAGPLRGLLELSSGFSADELEAVTKDIKGEKYEALGKRIINKWIGPPVIKLLNILRINYGQYWIKDFTLWDSQEQSLGNYCRAYLDLMWSIDGGNSWNDFVPNELEIHVSVEFDVGGIRFKDYLTSKDWITIRNAANTDFKPSLAAFLINQAHQAADSGDLNYAFVIAVTALEVAIDKLFNEIELKKSDRDNLQSRLLTAVSLSVDVDKKILRMAIKAISIRNDIVHKAFIPDEKIKPFLYALISVTSSQLTGPKYLFPSIHHGNARMSIEKWGKVESENE